MRHITEHCIVDAEDGTVFLECGQHSLSLDPKVARRAGDNLLRHADVAEAQQRLPRLFEGDDDVR